MGASVFVGRVGGLAVALGIGVCLGGCLGVASAAPAESTDPVSPRHSVSASPSRTDAGRSQHSQPLRRAPARPAGRDAARSAASHARSPATADQPEPGSGAPAAVRPTLRQRRAASSVAAPLMAAPPVEPVTSAALVTSPPRAAASVSPQSVSAAAVAPAADPITSIINGIGQLVAAFMNAITSLLESVFAIFSPRTTTETTTGQQQQVNQPPPSQPPPNSVPVVSSLVVGTPDGTTGVVTGSVTATDPEGDTVTYGGSASTPKGSVIVAADGSFTYTPTDAARRQAYVGSTADKADSFTVAVSDGRGGTTLVAVAVTVLGAAAPPPPPPSGDHVAVGMNLENVVDWSPAWTFTDAFKASRPWIAQTFNPQTWALSWDDTNAPTLNLDSDGNVTSLKTWVQNGVTMKQYAGTLMFRGLGGDYAGGTYHAEWDGTGVVDFGFDATVISSGTTAGGRHFAELAVTPTDNGIYMRIEETSPADPVRNFNVWMPDYNGQSFKGQRWQPGAAFSPFHPLYLARLAPFKTLRFMGMQETNTSDIVTWDQRRDANDIRQGSGSGGTPSEPVVNGMSLEYMVELANELDADPWFNMPYQADDTFVRNFATYVTGHLEPNRTVYVEWANEVWNFGWGFEASRWVADKAAAAHLDPDYGQWIVAGQEAKRDLDIWSNVFAGQSLLHLVRVAAGWAAVDWVTNEIASNMGGSFDAIAFAPYITPTDAQRASYSGSTTVEQVLADTRGNIATSVQWTSNHLAVAQNWSTRLGRQIQLLTYEGGPHLDGRNASYQNAFYAASNDARMGDIYRDYIRALDGAGLDLYMDFQFTGQAGAASWGDFAKLHRMDQNLATAYRYNAVVSAADGSLWSV